MIADLLNEGAADPLAGDIDGDGTLSPSEIAMQTAEQWGIEGIQAFRNPSRRRNKRCDTCCPPPLFYYSIESIGKWEYDASNPDFQEVRKII